MQTDSSGNLSVAGAKPSMLSVSVDGISSVSPRSSAPIAELFPSFGAIAEIRVSEINNAAEFGGVSDITTTSRGGSNHFHGGMFNNFQNTALNARNTFSATVPKLDMNDFGVFVGGPVRIPHVYSGRDKTFFFASYEGLRLAKESVLLQSVPSTALRAGDLSAYKSFKDPDTGAPFPDNQIPISRISPISARGFEPLLSAAQHGRAGRDCEQLRAKLSDAHQQQSGRHAARPKHRLAADRVRALQLQEARRAERAHGQCQRRPHAGARDRCRLHGGAQLRDHASSGERVSRRLQRHAVLEQQ